MALQFAYLCSYFADGYIQGRLYDVGRYPAAVESAHPTEQVSGEVYRIKNKCILAALDEYEGCSLKFPEPREYCRKKLPVNTSEGSQLSAWVYVYNRDVSKLKRISSGEYLR